MVILRPKIIKYILSISEAARDTNYDPSNIKKVCDGKYKTTNKLKWKYYMEK